MTTTTAPDDASRRGRRISAAVEIALLLALLFVFAGSPPPGDDEPHYLGKAKQYWNPAWLAGDFFLETPDAHVVFNWTVGWLTLFFSLDATAWIARGAAWLLLAIAWQRLSFAVVPRRFVSLLTMALFLVFQQYGTAAREWIVGGVEAKCFAWALLILALEQLVRTGFGVQGSGFSEEEEADPLAAIPTGRGLWRWNLVFPLLGLAAAFHVLVGGWAVVAALLTWVATKHRPSLVSLLPSLALGGVISLLGVLPALQLSSGAAADIVGESQEIYVFDRLNHHLVIHDFPWLYRLQFLGVLAGWLTVCWLTRTTTRAQPLRKFVLGSLVIASVGIVIDQATLYHPELAAALLRFYWFRLADMMVPIGLAVGLAELWESLLSDASGARTSTPMPRKAQLLLAALCLLAMVVIGLRSGERLADRRSGSELQAHIAVEDIDDWRATCAWIKQQTPANSRFLTPPLYQCFRWRAERSEVASWKDIPQSAAGIVEWRERERATRSWWNRLRTKGYTPAVARRLRQIASEYDVQYVIVPHALYDKRLPLTPIFSSSNSAPGETPRGYTVYWIPPNGAQTLP